MVQIFVEPADKSIVTPGAQKSTASDLALQSLGKLPPFSPVLTRLMAALAREDVSFASLADLVEKDPVLAGNMLRLVNSALYGRRGTVNSVRQALHLLGLIKVRNATLSLSVSRMWTQTRTPPGWSMARFNLHSVAVAILADLLSQSVKVNYPEGAFVAGLFHDLGQLLIAVGLPDPQVRQASGLDHAELSADALALWNLPPSIQTAVRYHHSPESDPTPVRPGEVQLSRLIGIADGYVNHAGISVDTASRPDEDSASGLASLELGTESSRILENFDKEFSAIKSVF